MKSQPIEIILPLSLYKIHIKQWITGGQSEYIQAPLFEAINLTPKTEGGVDMGKMEMSKIIESNHREIESFVISIDGNDKDILKLILELPESDYSFLTDKIKEQRKKK